MTLLPSYEEAVSGGHWLDLAAPYVSIRCYFSLCRVSRRFYLQFAPRLWSDPLQAARHLGLHPNDDLKWLVYFITRHASIVRLSTRLLVTSLDFGVLALDAPALVAGASSHSLTDVLQQVAVVFPAARCILIAGKTNYDPAAFGRRLKPTDYPEDGSVPTPLVLDIARCGLPLPNNFFHLSYWRQLVFLDMSHLPGSLQGIIKTGTFSRGALPALRILKLRGRGLKEENLAPIADFAKGRVWSLDLGQNRLTDACIHSLLVPCFGADDLTADASRADVEGKLLHLLPPVWRGWMSYIQESPSSGAFSHPDRHLADAPGYVAGPSSRLAGHAQLQSDSVQDIKIALAGGLGSPIPDWHDARGSAICKAPSSLTHLHLSGNPLITVEGVEAVFRRSRGHIRHFDCAAPLLSQTSSQKSSLKLAGLLGRSHIFRPVFASNLQSLRVHHSLVTHVPTWLEADPARTSALSALQYAETVLRRRAELAFPLTFVPDLNPRLQSLTLTCLPRVSAGPLIDKLIHFLISAAHQEAAIRHTVASLSRRSPTLLRGLRHIRLEFDPWPRRTDDPDDAAFACAEACAGESSLDSLDAGALLDAGADDFSFFKDSVAPSTSRASPASHTPSVRQPAQQQPAPGVSHLPDSSADATSPEISAASGRGCQSDRLSHYPLPGALSADSEYVCEIVSLEDVDGARHSQTVAVWVGSGYAHDGDHESPRRHSRAAEAYMANLANPLLRAATSIRPATPDQVQAGVPFGVCVYNLAWDAIVSLGPGPAGTPPAAVDKMQDVVDAIRTFRSKTRAEYAASLEASRLLGLHDQRGGRTSAPTHRHWMGKLEIMFS